jgi:hypothetical protein
MLKQRIRTMAISKSLLASATKGLVITTAALGALGMVSSSVYASLTATASNTTGGSINTGTMKLTQAPSVVVGITGGFVTPVTLLAPGDTVRRYVDLTNTGSIDAAAVTLTSTAAVANALTTDGTAGLQVVVKECAVAWTNAGVCTPGSTTVLASTSLLSLATAKSLVLSSVLSAAVNHLQFAITLPAGSEVTVNGVLPVGTIQGLTSILTWNFSETMRTVTTTDN